MSRSLTNLRSLGRHLAFGPEYDATAPYALKLSGTRLGFIVGFFLALLPSLDRPLVIGWFCVSTLAEFWLRHALMRQIAVGSRATRMVRIVSSFVASSCWVAVGVMLWFAPDPNLRLAGLAIWTGMFLYAQTACSRFPGHFLLIGSAPVLAIALIPLLTPDISLAARITIECAVALCLVHTFSGALAAFNQHRRLSQTARELVAQREAAENASQAKSDFLAMMSHELRTPLNGVLGLAHALAATGLTRKQQGLLEGITRSGDGLMSILNDILDLTKIEAGCMEIAPAPTDIHALAQEVRALFAPAAAAKVIGLRLSIDTAAPQWVMTDPLRVKQVMMNLVSNALKFTAEGEVRIELGLCWSVGGQRALLLRVDDTGPGLTQAARAKLFQRFAQGDGGIARSHGGTGLGLAVSRDLARAMDGDLSMADRPGPGASFEFLLPLHPCEAPADTLAPAADIPAEDAMTANVSILVVEDNPTNRSVVQALLEPTGWKLAFAENGVRGLEALRAGGPFDLVLMDIHMPVMDGVTALAAIRAGHAGDPNIPVIALTADAMSGRREHLMITGFDGYVEKPIRPHLLLATIQTVLETDKATDETLLRA
jgi:signal transduction histidine kinase/CheY-like chemotaxis protein